MDELEKIDLLSLTKDELTAEITAMGEKAFRAKQIYEWLHVKKITDFSQNSVKALTYFRQNSASRQYCFYYIINLLKINNIR